MSEQGTMRRLFHDAGIILLAVCIWLTYGWYGINQEAIMSEHFGPNGEKFTYPTMLLLVQCLVNALFAATLPRLLLAGQTIAGTGKDSKKRVPAYRPSGTPALSYLPVSACYILAMVFSYTALEYIDYPTQALGKACKPIAVMLMGLIGFGRQFTWSKRLSVAFITISIIMFMRERVHGAHDDELDPTWLWVGRALIFMSLSMDSMTGNLQDRLVHRHKATWYDLMFFNNLWASVLLAIYLAVSGELWVAFPFCKEHFAELAPLMGSLALSSGIGQLFIYVTLHTHGSLSVSVVTTVRKFITILVSVFWFGHVLSSSQWLSVLGVFVGLLWHVLDGKLGGRKKSDKGDKKE